MKKILFSIIALSLLIILPAISAEIYKQNTTIDIKIPTNLTNCNVTISYPNSTNIILGASMDNQKGYANYTLYSPTTEALGNYGAYSDCGSLSFGVTPNGEPNASGLFLVFIWIMFIVAIIGLIMTFFLTIAKLATSSETISGVLMTWGFFFLVLITDYLAKNYISDSLMSGMTSLFITITTWSNGVLPLISLVITMFVKGTQKKKPMSVQELNGSFGRYGY